MQGHIESYDTNTQTGVIKSEKKYYPFYIADWLADVPPEQGDDVIFDCEQEKAININLMGVYLAQPKAVKSRYIAAGLALVLGFAGVHRFYLGYYKIGLAQLALMLLTRGYSAVWGLVDLVLILAGHINKDAKGRPLK